MRWKSSTAGEQRISSVEPLRTSLQKTWSGLSRAAAESPLCAESTQFSSGTRLGELEDFGEGRVGSLNRLIYTRKESGEVADVKTARLVYTVRDGMIVRYELESLDESEVTGDPGR